MAMGITNCSYGKAKYSCATRGVGECQRVGLHPDNLRA